MPEPILLTLAHYARLGRWSDVRFHAAAWIFHVIMPDYYLSLPRLTWFKDPLLRASLTAFDEPFTHNASRRLMLIELCRLVEGVPGDTAECGVYKGLGSYLIATSGRYQSRPHHAFDSFEGMNQPCGKDGSEWAKGDMAVSLDTVKKNLAGCQNITYYPGWIPERFADIDDKSFAFVHLDVDLYQPTLDSLRFFYPRLNAGGILVCDDYGFDYCPGATAACDEFLEGAPEKIIRLPGGGGFFMKGVRTA